MLEIISNTVKCLSIRSSNQRLLNVSQVWLKLRGDHTFVVAAPKLWSSLPVFTRIAPLHDFEEKLKIYLFSLAFNYSRFV